MGCLPALPRALSARALPQLGLATGRGRCVVAWPRGRPPHRLPGDLMPSSLIQSAPTPWAGTAAARRAACAEGESARAVPPAAAPSRAHTANRWAVAGPYPGPPRAQRTAGPPLRGLAGRGLQDHGITARRRGQASWSPVGAPLRPQPALGSDEPVRLESLGEPLGAGGVMPCWNRQPAAEFHGWPNGWPNGWPAGMAYQCHRLAAWLRYALRVR